MPECSCLSLFGGFTVYQCFCGQNHVFWK